MFNKCSKAKTQQYSEGEKCEFNIHHFSYIIRADGVLIQSNKVSAVTAWASPCQIFVGPTKIPWLCKLLLAVHEDSSQLHIP